MSSMAIFRSPSEMSNPIIGCERCGKNHAVDYPCEFIAGLERERDGAENESVEMARLLGMSGEREAALVTKLDEANRQIARLQMELDASCSAEELRQARQKRDQWRECAQAAVCALRHWQARGPLTTDGGHYETNKAIVEFDWLQKQFAGVIEGLVKRPRTVRKAPQGELVGCEVVQTKSDLSPSANLEGGQ